MTSSSRPATTLTAYLALSLLLLLQHQCQPVDSMSTGSSSSNTGLGAKVIITPNINPVLINIKESKGLTLSCKTDGAQPEIFDGIKWTGPNREDNFEDLKKRHLIKEATKKNAPSTLTFINPTTSDNGEYYCFATYHGGDTVKDSVKVQVFNPIEVSQCQERQVLTRGSSSGKISCRITGDSVSASISKDGVSIEDLNGRYKSDNNDGLVIVGEVSDSDAGIYTFAGHSELTGTNSENNITVEVQSMPEIVPYNDLNGESEFHSVDGEPATLKCNVTGKPQPLVFWRDPGRRNLTSVGGYVVTPESGTLFIQKVNKLTDHGQFECIAYNSVGSTSRNVSMSVDSRPDIRRFDNKTVDEGSDVTFDCRASGEPEPKFSIRKQGNNQEPYREGDGFFKRQEVIPEGGDTYVYAHKLTMVAHRSQFGLHYCNATNRAGSAERYNHLYVNYKPNLSNTPAMQYVRPGKNLILRCHITAYPPPQVTWWSDRTQIFNADLETETSLDNQIHVFKMSPPNPQQLAYSTFTCRAENKMGIASVEIKAMYTTLPGPVSVNDIERNPTSVGLTLSVTNDGGDRVRNFTYKLDGRPLDIHNPYFNQGLHNDESRTLYATSRVSDRYFIKNLRPYYSYRMTIHANNDVGKGEITETHFETLKPTKPLPPIIIKPTGASKQHSTPGIPSEYNNAFQLQWYPPEQDNGDPIIRYTIATYTLTATNSISEIGQPRVIEQTSDRPLHAMLGPLAPGNRIKIEVRAVNKFGESDADIIVIYTRPESKALAQFEPRTLAWLIEPSTSTVFTLLAIGILLLILVDLLFCFFFQIGMSFKIQSWCCPPKANSMTTEKFTEQSSE